MRRAPTRLLYRLTSCSSVARGSRTPTGAGSGAALRAEHSSVRLISGSGMTGGAPIVSSTAARQPVLPPAATATAAATAAAAPALGSYADWEVRALVLALLPPAVRGSVPTPCAEVLQQLPAALRQCLARYPGGLPAYCAAHMDAEVAVCVRAPGHALQRRTAATHTEQGEPSAAAGAATAAHPGRRPPPLTVDTAPPPPPLRASQQQQLASSDLGAARRAPAGDLHPGRAYTTIELLDVIVEYIPTFFVSADSIAATIPSEVQRLYTGTSFTFFMKRFRHYVDVRTTHGHAEMRLKLDLDHPKRGLADEHHGGRRGLGGGAHQADGAVPHSSLHAALARPPRHSEANLIQYLVPRLPKDFTPLVEVLQDVSDFVSRHPSFDPRLGVAGLLEKYPEYVQIVEGKLRTRPYRTAPNALGDCDLATSPLPAVFAKIQTAVDTAAAGKNYADEEDRAAAVVPTGRLYVLLTPAEKTAVKEQCRSFPRFLRLHGAAIVVSPDSMRVYKFMPEYERCAETLRGRSLSANALSPDDPVLKIPAAMDDATQADWAVKELYDSLPLTQCAVLSDVLSLVPPAVREALPQEPARIASDVLAQYPEYFLTWRYPDDESVIIVQRTKIDVPAFETADIVRMVFPLIPQGGAELQAVRRRAPLALQRYFDRHGMKKTLGGMPQHFRIAGDRIIRLS